MQSIDLYGVLSFIDTKRDLSLSEKVLEITTFNEMFKSKNHKQEIFPSCLDNEIVVSGPVVGKLFMLSIFANDSLKERRVTKLVNFLSKQINFISVHSSTNY